MADCLPAPKAQKWGKSHASCLSGSQLGAARPQLGSRPAAAGGRYDGLLVRSLAHALRIVWQGRAGAVSHAVRRAAKAMPADARDPKHDPSPTSSCASLTGAHAWLSNRLASRKQRQDALMVRDDVKSKTSTPGQRDCSGDALNLKLANCASSSVRKTQHNNPKPSRRPPRAVGRTRPAVRSLRQDLDGTVNALSQFGNGGPTRAACAPQPAPPASHYSFKSASSLYGIDKTGSRTVRWATRLRQQCLRCTYRSDNTMTCSKCRSAASLISVCVSVLSAQQPTLRPHRLYVKACPRNPIAIPQTQAPNFKLPASLILGPPGHRHRNTISKRPALAPSHVRTQHQHPHPLGNSTHRTPHVLATPPRCTLTHPYLAIVPWPLVGQRMLISRKRKAGHTTTSTLHHTIKSLRVRALAMAPDSPRTR